MLFRTSTSKVLLVLYATIHILSRMFHSLTNSLVASLLNLTYLLVMTMHQIDQIGQSPGQDLGQATFQTNQT
jgi:hypothetical protein